MRGKRVGAVVLAAVLVLVMVAAPAGAQQKERFGWLIADKATVQNQLDVNGTSAFVGAVTLAGGLDLNGSDLTIDTDGDSILDENTDDAIRLTLGAASGTFSVLTGNLKVGNGTPTTAKNGEDLYVEGNAEFDSQARFDGAVGFNSTITTTLTNTAGNSANPWDWTATAGIMDNNDDLTVIDINLTNANHTGAGNTVQAIDIAGITQDAQATETAINIGAGWDVGLAALSPVDVGGGYGSTGCTFGVGGEVSCDGGVIFKGDLSDAAAGIAGAFTIDDTHVNVTGSVFDSGGTLVLGDATQITSTLDILGAVQDSGGDLELNDNVVVTGNLYDSAAGIAGALTLSDSHTNIQGSIFDSGGDLTLGDSVVITSTLDAQGAISRSTGLLYLNDDINVGGYIVNTIAGIAGALQLNDDHVDVTGSIFDSGGTLVLGDATQITSTLDVLGAVSDSGGNLELDDAVNISGDVTLSSDATGGDAGAKVEFIGLPRIRLAGVGVKDGAGEVEVDDSPAGEWSAIDGDVTVSADTAHYKVGANSLKMAFAGTATAGDGATSAKPGGDWTGMKSIGFWLMADKVITAAQLTIYLTDATDPATFNTCAITTANVWTYCEVDVSSLAGTVGDAVTDISFLMAAGLPVEVNVWVDNMVVWAAADEVSLVVAVRQDGDLGFINALTGAALDPSEDYTIAWRTGADYIVVVADLDPDGAFGLVAY